jgi:Cu(I)/Ag(I) efflux system membrane fusion protein
VDFVGVDHPGIEIQQGQTLIRLFSPDLVQRSRFFRVAMSNQPAALSNANKNAFLPPSDATQTRRLTNDNPGPAATGYRLDLFTSDLASPISGIVSERLATVGQYVMEGQKIATVIDPSVLWFRFDASERQLRWIAPGQAVEITTESVPEKSWKGTVALIEPVSSELRGFAKARAVVTNGIAPSEPGASFALRPGMLAEGNITLVMSKVLTVPKSAVIYPGTSAWVYVEQLAQSYERRRVRLGREGDDGWEILSGVEEGERVVTTGNVLIDAQATFENGEQEAPSSLEGDGAAHSESSASVESVGARKNSDR